MTIYIHPKALCESDQIGAGTRIWAFVHILPHVAIGADCNICDYVYVEEGAKIGDRVTIKSGVQIWSGVQLEDDVFVGPNVTFTNDKYPRSKNQNFEELTTIVKRGASIGANSTILPGVTIGEYAMVGAGSVVTRNVDDNQTVFGNPAVARQR